MVEPKKKYTNFSAFSSGWDAAKGGESFVPPSEWSRENQERFDAGWRAYFEPKDWISGRTAWLPS